MSTELRRLKNTRQFLTRQIPKHFSRPLRRVAYVTHGELTNRHGQAMLFRHTPNISFIQKLNIIKRFYTISNNIDCKHHEHEMLAICKSIFAVPRDVQGCVVEAGCYKGGSTAKLSIAARSANRQLIVFDSFEGLPPDDEPCQTSLVGCEIAYSKGDYRGTFDEVKQNVRTYGEIDVCEFIKGWFDDTLPHFAKPIAMIFLDVDLASSTRTCIKYLYPLLTPGGVLYSHDGDLPNVISAIDDDAFWNEIVGYAKPSIEGLRKEKLLKIVKPEKSLEIY